MTDISTRPEYADAALLDLICTLAGEVLEREMTPDEDFFMAGGDSMLAMHLVGRLSRATGLKVRVAHLIANPVLREFGEQVEQLRQEAAADTVPHRTDLAAALGSDGSAGGDRAV